MINYFYPHPMWCSWPFDHSKAVARNVEMARMLFNSGTEQMKDNMRYCNDLMHVHSKEELHKLNKLFAGRAMKEAFDNVICMMVAARDAICADEAECAHDHDAGKASHHKKDK